MILWAISPPVPNRLTVAFAPWIMFGSTIHVLYKQGTFPETIEVLFSSPTVYITFTIIISIIWILGVFLHAAGLQRSISRFVGITGTGFFIVFAHLAIFMGWRQGAFEPFWPVVAVIIAGLIAAVAWVLVSLWFTEIAAVTGLTGALVVFAHSLDGVSTAIGFDVIGAGEQVPTSALLLEAGASLPTAEFVGAGWLFVLIKVLLALAVLGLFSEILRDWPHKARLVLVAIAAVGLGPGVHNLLLFTVA
ncbi:MAG: DUF63 family protein [Natrialbaceae archaeon]|nr:DUF63 family protein [Natrialbaceae archaeon]